MNNKPRYISGYYCYNFLIDLLEEEIDPEDVKDYYIKWHTLYITHMDGSETEHELAELNYEYLDTKRPASLEVKNEEWEDAEFPNLL